MERGRRGPYGRKNIAEEYSNIQESISQSDLDNDDDFVTVPSPAKRRRNSTRKILHTGRATDTVSDQHTSIDGTLDCNLNSSDDDMVRFLIFLEKE